MNFLLKFTKTKLVFRKPNKKSILIYDRLSEDYSKCLFPKKNCEFMDVRYESINIYVLLTKVT